MLVLSTTSIMAQDFVEISGQLSAVDDVEGIHILNLTANKFTISDEKGAFKIAVRLNDTLTISSLKYNLVQYKINEANLFSKSIFIQLEERVNQLDQVIVGKILTGNLDADIENTELEPQINFYDVGIPGYTGPKKTQAQRRLYEANSGFGLIPLNPLLNAISGRTKRLKALVKLEKLANQLDLAKAKYADLIFKEEREAYIIHQFFEFVGDDPHFLTLSYRKNELEMLDFLIEKKTEFLEILKQNEED